MLFWAVFGGWFPATENKHETLGLQRTKRLCIRHAIEKNGIWDNKNAQASDQKVALAYQKNDIRTFEWYDSYPIILPHLF